MKLEASWPLLINFFFEASLGKGKGCIRFRDKLDQISGFHGNRKCPLTYNGENNVSTFYRPALKKGGYIGFALSFQNSVILS